MKKIPDLYPKPIFIAMKIKTATRILGPVFGIGLFLLALWVLHDELEHYRYHQIIEALKATPLKYILLAILFTILNYLALCFYDILAFRYIKNPLSALKIGFASFVAYAFSNNVGFYTVSGSAVRYRLYSGWGLSKIDITRVIAICSVLTFWLGLFTICGIVFVIEPARVPAILHLPFGSVRAAGTFFLIIVGGYLIWNVVWKKTIRFKTFEFNLPPVGLSISLILTACADWLLFGAVLYMLLPLEQSGLSYWAFLSIFFLAQLAGLISHVPGGIGIFETVILLLLPAQAHSPSTVGALVLFRLIYYLIPLALSAIMLGVHEALRRKEQIASIAKTAGDVSSAILPGIFALLNIVAGAILLFSGATPAKFIRIEWLMRYLPLTALELSHLLGSMVGAVLLMLAWGLYRRLDGAYVLTLIMLGAGALFSLVKGLDYEEASVLIIMILIMLPCHRFFYRRTVLVGERFAPGWIAAVLLIVSASIWLGMFAYKYVDYAHHLWWQFSFTGTGNASRFLRASVGAITVVLLIGVRMLFAPMRQKKHVSAQTMVLVRALVAGSPRTSASLALLDDKSFLINDTSTAFIMYGVQGRTWVAMGDPIGPAADLGPLLWQYREMCDRHAGWPVFYEVGRQHLPLYLDMGLSLLKIGEEARVNLAAFSIDGGFGKGFRQTLRKIEQANCSFEIIPQSAVAALLPTLHTVSDIWLEEKNTREKGFSLGRFDEEYVSQFPCAVVRDGGGILAFATLWQTNQTEEISVDLMRYTPHAPASIMEYLFVKLMLWSKEQGYGWFNLGIAPFSGIEGRLLGPLWNRAGALLFNYGKNFYNFQGLRQYKEKFGPVWEPRYMAAPRGLALPFILKDISTLISGDIKGVFGK